MKTAWGGAQHTIRHSSTRASCSPARRGIAWPPCSTKAFQVYSIGDLFTDPCAARATMREALEGLLDDATREGAASRCSFRTWTGMVRSEQLRENRDHRHRAPRRPIAEPRRPDDAVPQRETSLAAIVAMARSGGAVPVSPGSGRRLRSVP